MMMMLFTVRCFGLWTLSHIGGAAGLPRRRPTIRPQQMLVVYGRLPSNFKYVDAALISYAALFM